MKQLTFDEIDQVSGGCAEYCWGDFSMAGLGASIAAGAIGAIRGGFAGIALGAISGGIGYAGSKIGDKMAERVYTNTTPSLEK